MISLSTLADATRQQIFDQVVQHARSQRRPAKTYGDDDGACSYLTPDGRKCFIGCLISPLEYDALDIDAVNNSGSYGLRDHLVTNYNMELYHQGFLAMLQRIHDMHPVSEWDPLFEQCAERYGLKYTPQPIAQRFA